MNTRFLAKSIFVLFLFFSQTSCTETEKKDQKSSESSKKNSVYSRIDSSWQAMIQSDDNKISNLTRLCEELNLIEGSQQERIQILKTRIGGLKSSRYTQDNVDEERKIDTYDSITNKVISDLFREIDANPNSEKYQIILQLRGEILAADDSVLWYRKEYDKEIDNYYVIQKKSKKKEEIQRKLGRFRINPEPQ